MRHISLPLLLCLPFGWCSAGTSGFSTEELELAIEQEPTNKLLLLEISRRYHEKLLAGATEAVWKKAQRYFDLLGKQFRIHEKKKSGPVKPIALALHSSYKVLSAKRIKNSKSKIFNKYFVNTFLIGQGSADLDNAVAAESKNLKIRLIRARNAFAFPETKRLGIAITDLRYVITACEKDPRQAKGINVPELYLIAGKCASTTEDFIMAKEIWTLLRQKYSGSKEAEQALPLLTKNEPKARRLRAIIENRFLNPPTNQEQ